MNLKIQDIAPIQTQMVAVALATSLGDESENPRYDPGRVVRGPCTRILCTLLPRGPRCCAALVPRSEIVYFARPTGSGRAASSRPSDAPACCGIKGKRGVVWLKWRRECTLGSSCKMGILPSLHSLQSKLCREDECMVRRFLLLT